MCGVLFCVWRGACVKKIDEDRLQRRDRNKRNVCVLGITFSGEQQENADNSKHDGTRSILPKLRPCNVGVLGITFSGEQQENADNSKHDGKRSILPMLRPCNIPLKVASISIVEHCICQECNVKNVDSHPMAQNQNRKMILRQRMKKNTRTHADAHLWPY